jgi:hypothetical protein
MIVIDKSAHKKLADTLEFALNNGCAPQLIDRLQYLANYGNDPEATDTHKDDRFQVQLHADWADYSFAFLIQRRAGDGEWANLMNGGLIYHGPAQSRDPLAVEATPSNDHHWSLHT